MLYKFPYYYYVSMTFMGVDIAKNVEINKRPAYMTLLRDGFKTQPPVDRQFRPVAAVFYCSKQ